MIAIAMLVIGTLCYVAGRAHKNKKACNLNQAEFLNRIKNGGGVVNTNVREA